MSCPDTIFDRILRKEIPAKIVFENDVALAFHDINPQAPVHVLVIPKQRFSSLADFAESNDSAAIGAYMRAVAEVANHLGLKKNGYRVVFNTGRDGQQTVEYIHAHILGGRPMTWPPG